MIDDGTTGCWQRADGAGPTIVLAHGTMDRSSSFGRVARSLPGFRVVRYDRRGYGRSQPMGPPTGIPQQIDDLLEVVGETRAIVVGHSYGGTIALAAAVRDPWRVAGVVAYESPMPWAPWWPETSAGAAAVASAGDPEDAAEEFMRRMVGDTRWVRLPPSTRSARRSEGPTLVAEMEHMRPPRPPAYDPADVTVPVVAGHGTEGAPHHAKAAEALAAGAPDAELVVVEGAGHGVHLTHPQELAAMARRVAERLGWSPDA